MIPLLELKSLSKHFATHAAVDGISLAIDKGEFFSLVGPSGCGKTTTLRLIAGFEDPTSGEMVLNGQLLAGLPPYQRDVSTVFQSYALFPHLTVAQNVAFGLERRRLTKAVVREKVAKALSLVQLSDKAGRLPAEISGGEKQRVALARSLVVEPQLLLLDEPLAALDPKLRKQMRAELKDLQRRVGITFLFITHDQEEALSLSDRMAVMNAGRIEQIGKPKELYRHPASRFVAEFLGEVNWVNGAGVRPESVQISREQPAGEISSLPAVIEGLTFLGNRIQVAAKLLNGATCTVELEERRNGYARESFLPGETVHLWWHSSDELHIRNSSAK
jgi:spermidine/putrescine transport system ATP-binding protein